MYGINYQQSVYMLTVLIMFKIRLYNYLVKAGYTSIYIWNSMSTVSIS